MTVTLLRAMRFAGLLRMRRAGRVARRILCPGAFSVVVGRPDGRVSMVRAARRRPRSGPHRPVRRPRHDRRLHRPRHPARDRRHPLRAVARAADDRRAAHLVRHAPPERRARPDRRPGRAVSEVLAALTILLAPAGIVLGWLAVMAVIVASLSGAASGIRWVNPPQG